MITTSCNRRNYVVSIDVNVMLSELHFLQLQNESIIWQDS